MPVLLLVLGWWYFSCLQMYSENFFNTKRQSHKMVKYTKTIRLQFDDELFECVWPFCKIGA